MLLAVHERLANEQSHGLTSVNQPVPTEEQNRFA
jgi:hypothetical protein